MKSGGPRGERETSLYKAWVDAVKERDGYTCQYPGCGSQKMLHAHHIRNFKNNPLLRYSLVNGITYCEKHHKQKHFKRGEINEGIHNPLQYNEPKRYNQNKPRTIWPNYYSPKKVKDV